mmetsp:Transcript_16593/g.50474  ORF Transcript_16593/g.50474 Transcript_16593/m.50474 type:complete len:121 (+) Transcript_16593:144-506(+)
MPAIPGNASWNGHFIRRISERIALCQPLNASYTSITYASAGTLFMDAARSHRHRSTSNALLSSTTASASAVRRYTLSSSTTAASAPAASDVLWSKSVYTIRGQGSWVTCHVAYYAQIVAN